MRIINSRIAEQFREYLQSDEKSDATVEKYCRDVQAFSEYAEGREITKELVIGYKQSLSAKNYAARSINSMIAALNKLFTFKEWYDLRVKPLRLQKQIYCAEEKEMLKEDYVRLLVAAKMKNNERMFMILQTLCATGIRVSELPYITVESAESGVATVNCKGKTRDVFIPSVLQEKLKLYSSKKGIKSGSVFVTSSGAPVSRNCIWRGMKSLCASADVDPEKVFPHNLRHLFAREFYDIDKDIAKLADTLGHSSINTTRVYIISAGSEHKKIIEKMNLIM